MESTPKTIAVLIAAHNEALCIAATLESIARQKRKPDQLIVVDDASNDTTAAIVETFGAMVIRRVKPSGRKSIAQNEALPFITTDLVVTVDADTVLAKDTIEKLAVRFEEPNPPTGASAFILPAEIRSVWQRGRSIEYLFGQSFGKLLQGRFNSVLVAAGCCACWDVAAVRERGGFGSCSLAEDMDLTMDVLTFPRILPGNNRVVFVPDAFAYTLDPRTFRVYVRQMRRWYAAFFQNLIIHRKALLLLRRPRLSLLTLLLLLDGIGGTILFFGIPLATFVLNWHWAFLYVGLFFASALGIEGLVAAAFVLYRGKLLRRTKKKRGLVLETLRLVESKTELPLSILCYLFITNTINRCIFLWSGLFEILFRRPLCVWRKGH